MEDVGVMSRNGVEDETAAEIMNVDRITQAEQDMEGGEQLIPGIPNEITIDKIAPKLPWRVFHTLSSVSRSWRRAIKSRQVYDARVRSKSTQTLLVLGEQPFQDVSEITLFSIEEGRFQNLPWITGPREGEGWTCECISLNGKLYILGGVWREDNAVADVYVLDLAGQRHWQRCANMGAAREEFGCGVKDGKIYVFGGSSECEPVCGSEVYDPDKDAWSPIKSLPSLRFNHKVTTAADELFVHSGEVFDPNYMVWADTVMMADDYDDVNDPRSDHIQDAVSAEVYHPLKDEWRVLENFNKIDGDLVVAVSGNLYKLTYTGIQVYDLRANSWSSLRPFSFGGLDEPGHNFFPVAAIAVDDEVLALIRWRNPREEYDDDDTYGTCFIKSKGVGGGNEEIVWETLRCSLSFESDPFGPFMCSIQL